MGKISIDGKTRKENLFFSVDKQKLFHQCRQRYYKDTIMSV